MEAGKYKVLFADDEYWTREKIRRIIPWEKYNLEFLKPAEDGEQVLERLKQEQVDILITDINMPYISGVELLLKVQKIKPELITFVISGYDDFSYVKESFLAGSINYLVKPVDKIDLVNALSKALEIIGQRKTDREEKEKQQINIQKAASFIKDREFSQLIDGRFTGKLPDRIGNSHMEYVSAGMILIKIHDLKELIQVYDQDMNLLSSSVKKRLGDILQMPELMIFNHVYRANEFLIVGEFGREKAMKMAADIQRDFAKATESAITIVESEHRYSLSTLSEAYVQVISSMMLRPFGKRNVILTAGMEADQQRQSIRNRIEEDQMKRMRSYMQEHEVISLKKLIFEEIGLKYCEQQGWSYLEVRQVIQKIMGLVSEEVTSRADTERILDAQGMLDMANKAIEKMNVSSLMDILNEILDLFLNSTQPEATDSIKNGVKKAVQYINRHFQENLSLTEVAEKFHIESSYFSRMFRKEVGDTFVVYISKKRMEKAIEYMKKTDISLTEIAFLVGYDDYTYFNKVFRKMMGSSPREYRNVQKITNRHPVGGQ